MKAIISILIYGLCLSALEAKAEIEQATVTLPYSELLDLLERANVDSAEQAPPLVPPVDVIVQSALYKVNCTEPNMATLQADFTVENLSDQWQSVFLLEASEAIRSMDPPDAKLVHIDGGMHLLLEPNTSSALTIELQAEPSARSQGGQLIASFEAVSAARNRLQVIYGGDASAYVVKGAVAANSERTEFALPASGGPVHIKRFEPEAIQPTRWHEISRYWIRDLGGSIEVVCRLRLQATDGGLTTKARLALASPAAFSSVTAQGAGAGPRELMEMTADGPRLHLEWPHDEAMTRELMIYYTVPTRIVEGNLSVPLLQVANTLKTDAGCFVADFEGLELNPVEGEWGPSGRVPDWIGLAAGNGNVHYKAVPAGEALELSARMLPTVQTAAATIRLAEYSTELVAEGGMLHKAEITLVHGGATDYRVSLPEGGKLLSCSLNGHSTKPLMGEAGELIFNLPKTGGASGTTRVGYLFTTRGEKMNPVEGRTQLELPRTPLFIHRIHWLVHLPQVYQATALEGNVVLDSGGAHDGMVRLSKQICDDETPFAALYYTRRDVN